jgi:hypothetical protein
MVGLEVTVLLLLPLPVLSHFESVPRPPPMCAQRLDGALFDALYEVIETTALWLALPGLATRVEDLVHLLEHLALCFGGREEDVDQREPVKGAEDHVDLPRDVVQHWRHGEAQDAVPEPVGGHG